MDHIKAIIFDCFGVIYSNFSGPFFSENAELFKRDPSILQRLNLAIDLDEITQEEFYEGLGKATGTSLEEVKVGTDMDIRPDAALVDLMKRLKSRYKIGLITNAGREEIQIISRDGLDQIFDAMAISSELKVVKPDPRIYLECVRRLGVDPSECLFVDDLEEYLEAAKKLGMKTLHYPEFGKVPLELVELAAR